MQQAFQQSLLPFFNMKGALSNKQVYLLRITEYEERPLVRLFKALDALKP